MFERFADPMGFDPLIQNINENATSVDPIEEHVEGVRDAFKRGEIDEETYEQMMLSIGEAAGEAGI